jgi:hypothetical protein
MAFQEPGSCAYATDTSPEWGLLLCAACADPRPSEHQSGAVWIPKGLDWSKLLQRAERHGLIPLLYGYLVQTPAGSVPATVLDPLRDRFDNNGRRSLFLTGELLKCLDVLNGHGIPAIPFRGPVLAAIAYGDFALRQFDDLDLLLHEQDACRARDLLVSLGYQSEFQLNRAQEAAFLRSQSHFKVTRDAGLLNVELHWRMAEDYFSFPLDVQQLWQRLEVVSVAGRDIKTLSAEDLLLTLCVHGAKHLWARLQWLSDVARLIDARQEMDWGWVMDQAAALRSERMLYLGLLLASQLLGATLPTLVLDRIQMDAAVEPLARQVCRWLFTDRSGSWRPLKQGRFHLQARERWQDRMRYCLRLALTTTPGDWAAVHLPSILFPLYYVLRPARLLVSYGRSTLRRRA